MLPAIPWLRGLAKAIRSIQVADPVDKAASRFLALLKKNSSDEKPSSLPKNGNQEQKLNLEQPHHDAQDSLNVLRQSQDMVKTDKKLPEDVPGTSVKERIPPNKSNGASTILSRQDLPASTPPSVYDGFASSAGSNQRSPESNMEKENKIAHERRIPSFYDGFESPSMEEENVQMTSPPSKKQEGLTGMDEDLVVGCTSSKNSKELNRPARQYRSPHPPTAGSSQQSGVVPPRPTLAALRDRRSLRRGSVGSFYGGSGGGGVGGLGGAVAGLASSKSTRRRDNSSFYDIAGGVRRRGSSSFYNVAGGVGGLVTGVAAGGTGSRGGGHSSSDESEAEAEMFAAGEDCEILDEPILVRRYLPNPRKRVSIYEPAITKTKNLGYDDDEVYANDDIIRGSDQKKHSNALLPHNNRTSTTRPANKSEGLPPIDIVVRKGVPGEAVEGRLLNTPPPSRK